MLIVLTWLIAALQLLQCVYRDPGHKLQPQIVANYTQSSTAVGKDVFKRLGFGFTVLMKNYQYQIVHEFVEERGVFKKQDYHNVNACQKKNEQFCSPI